MSTNESRLSLVALTAYLLAVGLYLRVRGRIRPKVSLLLLLGRAVQVAFRIGPRRGELRSIDAVRGAAYEARLPAKVGARSDAEGKSSLALFEDGRPLGPPHADDTSVQEIGGGRYYHWYDRVVFSASDNTDPRANGRRYTFEVSPA